MKLRLVLSLLVFAASTGLFGGQSAAEFEVASVKPNTLNDRIVTIQVGPGGRFNARGYTLVLLIQRAYGVMDWNVDGGPAWIRSDRFDIAAVADIPGNLSETQLQPMLQKLLADRFKLRIHFDSKNVPGYALVVARGGPKLTMTRDGDEQRDSFRWNQFGFSGQEISMPTVARFVAGKLGVVAIDETGLQGLYNVKVDWKFSRPSPTTTADSNLQEDLRSLVFQSVEHQLGLKFNPQRISVQVIAIDNVEKPSPN